MKSFGWLIFFVLAFPPAVAAIVLNFEVERHPAAAQTAEALMRIATLLVVAGTAGGVFRIVEGSTGGGAAKES